MFCSYLAICLSITYIVISNPTLNLSPITNNSKSLPLSSLPQAPHSLKSQRQNSHVLYPNIH
jgi:hypothetical protein